MFCMKCLIFLFKLFKLYFVYYYSCFIINSNDFSFVSLLDKSVLYEA